MKKIGENWPFLLLKAILSILWVGAVMFGWFVCTAYLALAALGEGISSLWRLILSPCFPFGLAMVLQKRGILSSPLYWKAVNWGAPLFYVLLALGGMYLICKMVDRLSEREKSIFKRK